MKPSKKKYTTLIEGRIPWVLLFFFAAFCTLLVRIFLLQIVHHQEYIVLAAKQHKTSEADFSERGTIWVQDKTGNRIALGINRTFQNLVVSPKAVKNQEEVAETIVKEFSIPTEDLMKKISKKDDPYEIILKKVNDEAARKIEARAMPGVFFEKEKGRIYPHGSIAAHLLGFVSKEKDEEAGRYGIERLYEKELQKGKIAIADAKESAGLLATIRNRILHPPENGSDVLLTLDYNIQVKAEEVLDGVYEKWGAASGLVLVMDPSTGKILALAARPVFDPNEFSKEKDFSVFLNPAVESMYELGSVVKPLTIAAAMEEKKVTPDTTYTDPGVVKIGGRTVKNFDEKSYGVQTMTEVIAKSLNTGMVFVSRILGKEEELEYLNRFGLGAKTNVDLPGEVPGNISNLNAGRDIDFATASFGQGIAVTPIQMAAAIGALAHNGMRMQPYVVERIIDDSGNEVKKEPKAVQQVVSPETAEAITKMLVSAVRSGFENRAGVKGYFVAGKTGTAQIPRRDGRGYSEDVIHTFVGYAPAFNPKFLVLLQLNKPKGNRFAANTLTPAFHDLAEFILNYYEVPPDEK